MWGIVKEMGLREMDVTYFSLCYGNNIDWTNNS